jgi:CubicO group peptidase (beta-lactamase class C family)
VIRRIGIALAVFAAILVGAVLTDPAFWLRYAGAQLGSTGLASLAAHPAEELGENPPAPFPVNETASRSAIETIAADGQMRALVVLKDGAIVAAHYGRGFTPQTLFDGGALTRLLPTLVAGTLFVDGAFPAYDATVGTWLPGFAEAPRDAISLAHLLTSSSGLAVPHVKIAPYASATQFLLGTDIDAALERLPMVAAPGTLRQENAADAQLLLQTIERARGEDFARLFERRLWAPLGAGEARITRDSGGGRVLGHCCFAARAEDWARLGQLFVDRGRVGPLQLLPAQFLEDIGKPSAPDTAYGMGAERLGARHAGNPADLLGFRGNEGQHLWVSREAGVVIVAFLAPARDDEAETLLKLIMDASAGAASGSR